MALPHPDPTTPGGVAAATFNTVRKGADPDAVRGFLRQVAARMSQLESEIGDLRMQLADERGAPTEPDEARITQLLGEETARIVQAAREAAGEIRQKAEDAAAQMIREANDEISRSRSETEQELARLRAEAQAEALGTVDGARSEGRAMVAEAREYREKVLVDVNRRRELARQQLGDVEAGRRRLLQAFEHAHTSALAVLDQLGAAAPDDDADDFVNLSPTTGPVPLIVAGQRPPASGTDRVTVGEPPATEEIDGIDEGAVDGYADADVVAIEEVVEEALVEELEDELVAELDELEADADVVASDRVEVAEVEVPAGGDGGVVIGLYAGELISPLADDAAVAEQHERASVDDLFAKLRKASAEMVAREGTVDREPAAPANRAERGPFGVRDEVLLALITSSARKLKRVLADEQNEVLDRLRRNQLDDTLPEAAGHAARYVGAVEDELRSASAAGATSVGASTRRDPVAAARVEEALAESIVQPLRDRLQRAVDQAGADSNELASLVRAVYREWKSSRIDDQVDGVLRLAFDEGAFAAVATGTPVVWVLDPKSGACGPDCEDNSLGGAVAAGDAFPTGHLHPPLHGGCRCLLQTAHQ